MGEVRLAELMATLSLATDLGTAFPLEKALRNALLAVELGRAYGLGDDELSDAYYMAMLRFLGCTAYSHELAMAFGGDDNAFHATFEPVDATKPAEIVAQSVRYLARDAPLPTRLASVGRLLTGGAAIVDRMRAADCDAADALARRLGLSPGVRLALAQVWTRWDGNGRPGLRGEQICMPARLSLVANLTEIFFRVGGQALVHASLRKRRGADLDPDLVDCLLRNADTLFEWLPADSVWDAALAAEPTPVCAVPESRLQPIAEAFGDFVDLKSPYLLGHSKGVAALAEAAAQRLHLAPDDVAACRLAGLVHDVGRVGVPSGIWDKSGALSPPEWERVRLHPYYSERVLSQSPALRSLAVLAGMHHERRDGSGYHRSSAVQPIGARVLAAADAFQAMTQARAHRPALSGESAASELLADARAGRLDRDAVDAVLAAAGQARKVPGRRTWPAGLSDREVEVLRLVARGNSDRQIGRVLVISDVTVHHHVRHIYDKIGASSRAGAALFATEHELL